MRENRSAAPTKSAAPKMTFERKVTEDYTPPAKPTLRDINAFVSAYNRYSDTHMLLFGSRPSSVFRVTGSWLALASRATGAQIVRASIGDGMQINVLEFETVAFTCVANTEAARS